MLQVYIHRHSQKQPKYRDRNRQESEVVSTVVQSLKSPKWMLITMGVQIQKRVDSGRFQSDPSPNYQMSPIFRV